MASDERKERVIHTRIPAALEEQIKRLAEGLRVPVSNLVRNMLEDAIDVTRRVRDRVPGAMGIEEPPPAADLGEVFGWQPLTLNLQASCAGCGRELLAGDDAFLGLTDRSRGPKVFICPACLPRPARKQVAAKPDSKKKE